MPEKTGPQIVQELKDKAQWLRQTVLDMSFKAKSGHVTTAFSQAEMLISLYYGSILRVDPQNPKRPERDRFILSKGQGGIGTYPVLADLAGNFPQSAIGNREELKKLGNYSNITDLQIKLKSERTADQSNAYHRNFFSFHVLCYTIFYLPQSRKSPTLINHHWFWGCSRDLHKLLYASVPRIL